MASETLTNLIDKDLLAAFKGQADEAYVAQEYKTGSTTVKKVLSDNNLTDSLVAKINASGESDFSGAYADLTGKPTINGHEVSGALTAAGLGLATPDDVATATSDMATNAGVEAKGYQNAKQVSDAVAAGTKGMVTETALAQKGYQDASQVNTAVSTATKGMATQTWVQAQAYDTSASVDGKVSKAKSDMQAAIDSALTSAVTPKGSCAFAELPTPGKAVLGNMWNVTNSFTATEDFVGGAGESYPAGSNVVCVASGSAYKWDVQGGFYDLTAYVAKADVSLASVDDIKAMFA